MSRKILVTGGAGFIGSHLCERLIREGNEVVCLDNFFTGSRSNIKSLFSIAEFDVLRADVINPIHAEVDAIFNLACPASPVHYQRDPIQTTRTSVLGALNVLELARRLKVRVLQASTSEVYGDPEVSPQPEGYWGHVNPIGLRACYDEGKRCAETLFFDYHRQHGVDVRVARIFNTYGPRMQANDGRVVSNFIVQALRNEPLTVYGDGSHTRSFCYVDDLVAGLVALMDAPGEISAPVNLGRPEEMTVRALADLVIELTGSRSVITYVALPSDDPRQRRPDISRAGELLRWSPDTAARDGLVRTIAYFDSVLASEPRLLQYVA